MKTPKLIERLEGYLSNTILSEHLFECPRIVYYPTLLVFGTIWVVVTLIGILLVGWTGWLLPIIVLAFSFGMLVLFVADMLTIKVGEDYEQFPFVSVLAGFLAGGLLFVPLLERGKKIFGIE